MVAAATVGAAVVGGAVSAKGAKDAAGMQADAAKDAAGIQWKMYDQTRKDYAPYRQAGYGSLNKLGFLLGLDADGFSPEGSGGGPVKPNKDDEKYMIGGGAKPPQSRYLGRPTKEQLERDREAEMEWLRGNTRSKFDTKRYNDDLAQWQKDSAAYSAKQNSLKSSPEFGSLLRRFGASDFKKDPGYQFRMDEGIRGLDRSAAARGNLFSGAAMKALNRYNQDFASNEYGNAYNRYNNDQTNVFNRLAAISGIGQSATGQVATAGQNAANNSGNAIMQMGNAGAAGSVGAANAINGAFNSYQQYNMLNSILNKTNNPGNIGNQFGHTIDPMNER
jgi:hypothetical protein